jgi:hypothetical protein
LHVHSNVVKTQALTGLTESDQNNHFLQNRQNTFIIFFEEYNYKVEYEKNIIIIIIIIVVIIIFV